MALLQGRVHRMEALIDGILSYSRAGRVREKLERVDVGALIADTIELLALPAGAEVVIESAMPVMVTERVPLQQVFMNLIGNAIKYSERPDTRVTFARRLDEPYVHVFRRRQRARDRAAIPREDLADLSDARAA